MIFIFFFEESPSPEVLNLIKKYDLCKDSKKKNKKHFKTHQELNNSYRARDFAQWIQDNFNNTILQKGKTFMTVCYSERSEAEGRAERGIGLVKKKMNKKKRNDDDDDQFCTRSNILPFFFKFSHLCSFFSLQKVFMVSTTYQLFAKDILTKSFVRKKIFLKKNSNFSKKIFSKKKNSKIFFFEKKIRNFFFFEKIFLNFFFFENFFLTLI